MREYKVRITDSENGAKAEILSAPIQHTGENNATMLVVELNSELLTDNIDYYTLVFSLGFANRNCECCTVLSDIIAQGTSPAYFENGIIYYPLKSELTCFQSLGCQVEAHSDTDDPFTAGVIKSPPFEIKFNKSIIVNSVLCDLPAPDLRETLETIMSVSNTRTLSQIYCDSLEEEISLGEADDYDLKFKGDSVRLAKEGAVITAVDEIEKDNIKYLRLYLNKGNNTERHVFTPDYIDIPISTVTDVTEESGDIILNGTEIDFGIQNEVSSLEIRHIITSQTALTLSPNTFYSFGEVEALDITLGEAVQGRYCEYMFDFVSGASPTVLTLPADIIWVNELTVEANKRYEISIADNVALWCAVDVEVTAQ